jgi:uncharacterized membrane protein YphA (DoxX/SURF4 family)
VNIGLWITQVLLAIFFGMAGTIKTFQTSQAKQQFPWAKKHSDEFVRFIGISELLGALGLILPMLAGILSWLTPIAAIGLSLIQLLAIFTEHLPKKEYNIIPMNGVLLALAVFIILGRWILFS